MKVTIYLREMKMTQENLPGANSLSPPNSTSMDLELNKYLCSDQAPRLYEGVILVNKVEQLNPFM
jgi:hypothetical protein